ncbi:MAG: tetratricopeptide repeat protein [Acidobacteriota bacterium]
MPGSDVFGNYRLVRELGRGGMGVVYLAETRGDGGSLVALKTLRAPDPRLLGSLRREILALSRLDHPGIVRILDHGVNDGTPWYAMALERGSTLRDLVVDRFQRADGGRRTTDLVSTQALTREMTHAATGDLSISRAPAAAPDPTWIARSIEILARMCGPLAYLHGEGLVHRDLKPENVLLRADGAPVILDFGIAAEFGTGRENIDWTPDASGTALYMAPEQWTGAPVDARADLYALGCIAYELLTGRPPFFGETLLDLAAKHTSAEPLPRRCSVPDSSRDRRARAPARQASRGSHRPCPGRGPGARDRRRRAARKTGRPATAAARPAAGLSLPPGHRGPRRHPRGDRVRVARSRLRAGRSCARAEGRERDRQDAPRDGGDREGAPPARRLPHGPRRAGDLGAAPDDATAPGPRGGPLPCGRRGGDRAPLRKGRARLAPPGGDRAASATSPAPHPGQEPDPAPQDSLRQRLVSDVAELLQGFAAARPHMIVIDDLPWADDLTLAALLFLLRTGRLQAMPLLVLATARSEEPSGVVGEIEALDGCASLDVSRLDPDAVRSIVSDMLSDRDPPRPLVATLERHSEGNPLFLAEYLQAAIHEGLLVRDDAGRWRAERFSADAVRSLPLPATLRDLVAARIDALPGTCRAVIESAAVLGRELDAAILREMLDATDEALAAPLWDLARRRLLEEHTPGTLGFHHDKIREGTLAGMAPAHRAVLRARAAAVLSERRAGDPDALATLGHHFREAGDRGCARKCLLGAARHAIDTASLAEAEQLFRSYLELVDAPTVESVRASTDLAFRVLSFQGRTREAYEIHRAALADARALGDRGAVGHCLSALAGSLLASGDAADAVPLLEESLAIARASGDRRAEAVALRELGALEEQRGRFAEAESLHRQSLAIMRSTGDDRAACRSQLVLAMLLSRRGALEECERLTADALSLARKGGNRRDLAVALGGAALALDSQDRRAEARDAYEEARTLFRLTGDLRNETTVLINVAALFMADERWAEAREMLAPVETLLRGMNERPREAVICRNLATIDLWLGDLDGADAFIARAVTLGRQCSGPRELATILHAQAEIERLAGDPGRADTCLREAAAIVEPLSDGLQAARIGIAQGHHALMRGGDARAILEDARGRARSLGPGPCSRLSRGVERLEAAQAAFVANSAIYRGEAPASLSLALRDALRSRMREEASDL